MCLKFALMFHRRPPHERDTLRKMLHIPSIHSRHRSVSSVTCRLESGLSTQCGDGGQRVTEVTFLTTGRLAPTTPPLSLSAPVCSDFSRRIMHRHTLVLEIILNDKRNSTLERKSRSEKKRNVHTEWGILKYLL